MFKRPHNGSWIAAAAVAWSLAGGSASAATTLTIGNPAPNPDPIIAVNVGEQAGIFRKHGLDLKIVDFTGGAKMDQAMVAGDLDLANSAGADLAFIAKGVPMKAICESAGPIPFLGIGVPYDSPAKSLKDLKGKKIGVSTAGSFTDWLARELSRYEGWGSDGVQDVSIGNDVASIVAAFRTHLVDADVGVSALFFDMELKNTGRFLAPVSAYEGPVASGMFEASDHLIKTDPAAIRAFLAAWLETVEYIRTHKPETVEIESRITGFPQSVMSKDYDLTIGMFTKDCRFDKQSLETLSRSFVELKLLSAPPDMSKLYTEAFIPK